MKKLKAGTSLPPNFYTVTQGLQVLGNALDPSCPCLAPDLNSLLRHIWEQPRIGSSSWVSETHTEGLQCGPWVA